MTPSIEGGTHLKSKGIHFVYSVTIKSLCFSLRIAPYADKIKEKTMIIVRDVFQAKYGKGNDLVALFKEAKEKWSTQYAPRILTDKSGQFFTVVTETEFESLAAWEQESGIIFSMPEFGDWFERMTQLVESGRREFYNIEA